MKLANLASSIKNTMSDSQASAQLEQENERLKQQLASSLNGEFYLDITRFRPSIQVRQTFLEQEIKERAKSLLEEGQATAIILLPLDDNPDYEAEIEDGELTWRAAKWLTKQNYSQWQQLKCCWSTLKSEEDAHTKSVIHHRHKVDLNPLDEAEGLMLEIAKTISWSEQEKTEDKNFLLKPILGSISTKYQRKPAFTSLYDSLLTKTKEESFAVLNKYSEDFCLDERQIIVIIQLARFTIRNPQSFYKHSVPLVFLAQQLKDSIRHSTTPLSSNHAIHLSRVKDKQQQKDLIEQAQANQWSIRELKAAISKIQPPKAKSTTVNSFNVQKSAVQALNKALNTPSMNHLTVKQAKQLASTLRKKLESLDKIIQETATE